MPTARSHEVETLHRGELDAFETGLTAAGFRMQAGDEHHWIGPIDPALEPLTDATLMRIEVRDGWPYLHPYLFVSGLGFRAHVSASDNVCLWDEADDGYADWLSIERIHQRIVAWIADQARGPFDLPFDAHLYFGQTERSALLTLDVGRLLEEHRITAIDGRSGKLMARRRGARFETAPDGDIHLVWFWRDAVATPPKSMDGLRAILTEPQQASLDRFVTRRRTEVAAIVLVLWRAADTINGIAVRIGSTGTAAIEIARTDEQIVRLRSGPDAQSLADKHVVAFGLGAIGSEVVRLLAQAGVGHFHLVDAELLRPGNVTRHAASTRHVGESKVDAVSQTVRERLPYVEVIGTKDRLWSAKRVAPLIGEADLLLEATGNRAYRDFISRLTGGSKPLIGVALHRRGSIGRVVVEVGSKAPAWGRNETNGFLDIPSEPGRPTTPQWEVGCGAPVNNASPLSVVAIAATAAREAVEVLAGRSIGDHDVVEVFRPIEVAPFDVAGRLVFHPRQ